MSKVLCVQVEKHKSVSSCRSQENKEVGGVGGHLRVVEREMKHFRGSELSLVLTVFQWVFIMRYNKAHHSQYPSEINTVTAPGTISYSVPACDIFQPK